MLSRSIARSWCGGRGGLGVEAPGGVVGVAVGTGEKIGSASTGGVVAEKAPTAGDRPWQILILWPPLLSNPKSSCPGGRMGLLCGCRLNCQRCEPCSSRGPWSIVLPSRLWTVTQNRVKVTMQLALQSVPMLRRLLVNIGMMWPSQACPGGSVGRLMTAVAIECWHCPVAVPMVICGAAWLVSMTGAVGMK